MRYLIILLILLMNIISCQCTADPLYVNEIHQAGPDENGKSFWNDKYSFIELYNNNNYTVSSNKSQISYFNVAFISGIPTNGSTIVVPAYSFLLIVNNITFMRNKYNIPNDIMVIEYKPPIFGITFDIFNNESKIVEFTPYDQDGLIEIKMLENNQSWARKCNSFYGDEFKNIFYIDNTPTPGRNNTDCIIIEDQPEKEKVSYVSITPIIFIFLIVSFQIKIKNKSREKKSPAVHRMTSALGCRSHDVGTAEEGKGRDGSSGDGACGEKNVDIKENKP